MVTGVSFSSPDKGDELPADLVFPERAFEFGLIVAHEKQSPQGVILAIRWRTRML